MLTTPWRTWLGSCRSWRGVFSLYSALGNQCHPCLSVSFTSNVHVPVEQHSNPMTTPTEHSHTGECLSQPQWTTFLYLWRKTNSMIIATAGNSHRRSSAAVLTTLCSSPVLCSLMAFHRMSTWMNECFIQLPLRPLTLFLAPFKFWTGRWRLGKAEEGRYVLEGNIPLLVGVVAKFIMWF